MKTSDLVSLLSQDQSAPVLGPRARMGVAAGAGMALCFGVLVLLLGLRPELVQALVAVLAKAAFGAALASLAAVLVLRSLTPGAMQRGVMLGLSTAGGAAILTGLAWTAAAPEAERLDLLFGGGLPWCLVHIPLLALAPGAVLMWAARDLAPVSLGQAGAMIGTLAGAIGATVYSTYCPIDAVPFVTVWYTSAIALSAGLGALAGAKLLRW